MPRHNKLWNDENEEPKTEESPFDVEEKEAEIPKEEKKEINKRIISKPKIEYTINSISKGRVFAFYFVEGTKYGVDFPLNEEYKNLKPGDKLYL